jgi:phosphate-selective porin OprO/OprP
MRTERFATATAVGLLGALLTSQAHAQSAGGDSEIALLKQQLKLMEQKLDKLQKQTSANTAAAAKTEAKVDAKVASVNTSVANSNAAYTKGPIAPSGVVVTMPNNRPTICTADDQNCISIVSRLHFDVGGYDYRPNSGLTSPQRLDDGVNARRARIGVVGKFAGDWNYSLIYDFGGSSDGFGGAAAGSLSGGGVSGIENAFLSYTGIKAFGGKSAIEIGVMDLPYTLDEATSSNDTLFMERSSPNTIATGVAAGDFRSAFGARWYDDRFWAGAYVTGPATGAIHTASSATPNGTSEQFGAILRAAGQIVTGSDYSLHLGADAEFLIKPPHNNITNAQTLTLADRPELRIDPTTIVNTGALANVSGAQVYSVEAAGNYGPLFFQGEYYWYNVERSADTGLPPLSQTNVKFDGGYAQASYVLTGETHKYNASSASYGGIAPNNPFSIANGGWGAWEIAGRVSRIDLNDQLATANGVAGGRQTVYTAGLNWYANRNIRIMLNYLHGDIAKQNTATDPRDAGAKFDAVAMRTQIAF